MTTTPKCLRAGGLVARRSAGIGDAERIELERHLEHCARCADGRHRLDLLRATVEDASTLSAQSRARAIARAIEHAGTVEPAGTSRRARGMLVASFAVAVTAVLAVFVIGGKTRHEDATAISTGSGSMLATDNRDTSIATVHDAQASMEGVPNAREALAASATSLDLGRARVDLEPGALYEWHPDRSTFELRLGAATFDVDHVPRVPFSVVTPRFTVEVIGTRFRVSSSVHVERGAVRIVALDGVVLDPEVSAGETWSPPTTTTRPKSNVDVAATLVRARRLLASRDVVSARRELSRVLAAKPSHAVEAAARNLLADCARVDGDRTEAIRLYLDVAHRFPTLAAGEDALFSAARLEVRARRDEAARSLLREYLDQYPRGRFHDEATSQLRTLEKK